MMATFRLRLLASVLAAIAVLLGAAGAAKPSAAAGPAGAPQERISLEARNRAFLRAAAASDIDSLLSFFPKSGEFTYTLTKHRRAGDTVGIWRFPVSGARRAITDGPLKESLTLDFHAAAIGSLAELGGRFGGVWRRVKGTRFVPPPAGDSSRTYVEWRRDGSRWVVTRFGDEVYEDGMEPPWYVGGE